MTVRAIATWQMPKYAAPGRRIFVPGGKSTETGVKSSERTVHSRDIFLYQPPRTSDEYGVRMV
jgi:hypothetical protein